MFFGINGSGKDETKATHTSGRTDKVVSDYRRIEYAADWRCAYRTRPVISLSCDPRLKYGI